MTVTHLNSKRKKKKKSEYQQRQPPPLQFNGFFLLLHLQLHFPFNLSQDFSLSNTDFQWVPSLFLPKQVGPPKNHFKGHNCVVVTEFLCHKKASNFELDEIGIVIILEFMDMEVDNKEEGTSTDTGSQKFYIGLRPGETTIVSWKKLLKDAAAKKANSSQVNNQTAISASTGGAAVEPASVDASQQTLAESQFALVRYCR